MELRRILALSGPNIWGADPVLEVGLDPGGRLAPADAGTAARLRDLLPGLGDPGSTPVETLGRVTEHLQAFAWRPAGPSRVATEPVGGAPVAVIPFEEESFARECLAAAARLCGSAGSGATFDLEAERRRLRVLAEHAFLGPSTDAIARAARGRGIPVRRIGEYNLLQLGHGAKARRVWTAETDLTSAVAMLIAKDKEQTRLHLKAAGVPVPEGRPVDDADDAWSAAEEVGVPVVVKPLDGNHGRGVSTNLTTVEQVKSAYALARDESENVLVERHAYGSDYRILVVGGRVVAAAHREPAQVVGDGRSTVRQLVDEVNKDPRRGDEHATPLSKIYLDPVSLEVLREQGHSPDSVPAAGERVLTRRNANLSTGGTAADVTDRMHPETAARAVEAALAVGLDLAGIDVVARDISRPLEEQGGVVVEVNAGPGLRMHLEPSAGKPRAVGQAIVDMMFPGAVDGRIPLVGVLARDDGSAAARLTAHLLRRAGRKVGLACSGGTYLDGRRLRPGDGRTLAAAQAVLLNPAAEAAVLEATTRSALETGLGFDRCDVAVVPGSAPGPAEAQARAREAVARVLVGLVAPTGAAVLDATDPHAHALALLCPGAVIQTAPDERHPLLAAHRGGGGRVAFVRDGTIVLSEGAEEWPLAPAGAPPARTDDALAAAASAWALGVPVAAIRDGLKSFAPGPA